MIFGSTFTNNHDNRAIQHLGCLPNKVKILQVFIMFLHRCFRSHNIFMSYTIAP